MHFYYFFILVFSFLFFHPHKLSWKRAAHTWRVPPSTTVSVVVFFWCFCFFFSNRSHCRLISVVFFLPHCVFNSVLSRAACLPGQRRYDLECLFWSVSARVGKKAGVVSAWTQPKSTPCVAYAFMRVSVCALQVHEHQMYYYYIIFLNREQMGNLPRSCRFPNVTHCRSTPSSTSASRLKKKRTVWQLRNYLFIFLPRVMWENESPLFI